MKSLKKLVWALFLGAFVLTSCDKDDDGISAGSGSCYVINYGSYSGTKGSVSQYNANTNKMSNKAYEAANGAAMTSNAQYAYEVNGQIYFMGNNADVVFHVDAETLVQSKNGVTKNIVKPRYCVADGDFLYISCWGGDIWTDESVSYIAKFSLSGDSVFAKISLPGGPEGLAIANGKLYAALNYDTKIAVMNLATSAISYISAPAVSSYFVKDQSNNLYVSLVSTYSDYSANSGLGYINTQTDQLTDTFKLEGVSTGYASILQFSPDYKKIYVVASSYDANWVLSGGINVFDVASKTFEAQSFVSNVVGLNGLAVNPKTAEVYTFKADNTTAGGIMSIYSAAGDSISSFSTGISPAMAIFRN